jgi:hypothetical protein
MAMTVVPARMRRMTTIIMARLSALLFKAMLRVATTAFLG